MGAEAPVDVGAIETARPALLQNVLVLVGRGATGILPVLVTVLASRAYDLDVMGTIATAVAMAYAIAEVSDSQSQRHVTRLLAPHADQDSSPSALAAFNTLRFLILTAGLAAALTLPVFRDPLMLAMLSTAVWSTAANMLYARALADGRFTVLGGAPLVPVIVLLALAVGLRAGGDASAAARLGPWTLVIALHGARLGELAVLGRLIAWPGLSLQWGPLEAQWRQTRYLLFQTGMSAAHVRLLIPLVLFLGGAASAGVFSIGLSLLSILSLLAVAVTVPAYRRGLAAGSDRIGQMLARTARDLAGGLAITAAIGALLVWSVPTVLPLVFGVEDESASVIVRWLTLGGLFEAPAMFASAYYHAGFRDRQLFGLSVMNVALGWVLLMAGFMAAGLHGAAIGFLASRAASAAVLWLPLLRLRSVPRTG